MQLKICTYIWIVGAILVKFQLYESHKKGLQKFNLSLISYRRRKRNYNMRRNSERSRWGTKKWQIWLINIMPRFPWPLRLQLLSVLCLNLTYLSPNWTQHRPWNLQRKTRMWTKSISLLLYTMCYGITMHYKWGIGIEICLLFAQLSHF